MNVPTRDEDNQGRFADGIFKKLCRFETIFFIMAIPFLGYVSKHFDINQRNIADVSETQSHSDEIKDALSSLREIHESIASLREVQTTISNLQEVQDATLTSLREMQNAIASLRENQDNMRDNLQYPLKSSPSTTTIIPPVGIMEKTVRAFAPMRHQVKKTKNVDSLSALEKTRHLHTNSRELQLEPNQESAVCDGTLFRMELSLDENPGETTLSLIDHQDNVFLINVTFTEDDALSDQTFEECLKDGPYIVRLQDSWGDGIRCMQSFDGLGCYNIFINNELVIIGDPFTDAIRENQFDSSSFCLTQDTVIVETSFDPDATNTRLQIKDFFSSEIIDILPIEQENENMTKTYYSCLSTGIYDFVIKTKNRGGVSCDGDCYTVFVNDELVMSGSNFFVDETKTFFITFDGVGRERLCENRPYISPINDFSRFQFDDRVSKTLSVLQALSDTAEIFAKGSSQYKATCYVLYDDPLKKSPESPLFAERYAAALLFYATNQNAETRLLENHCDSPQFTCNDEGYITSINLAGNGLNGRIPTEIGHFEFLEILNLNNKKLHGTIPSHMTALHKLRHLSLDNNDLSGSIPTILGSLPLDSISIGNNQLSGNIPSELGNLRGVDLYLQGNHIEGSIPSELFNSIRMNDLVLNNNKLTGTLPTEFGKARALNLLLLNNNMLSGPIPSEIGQTRFLMIVDLGFNQFTGTIPSEINNVDQILSEFRLNDNRLTGNIPELWVWDEIYLNNNSLAGTVPDQIFNLTISGLKLQDNFLVGEVSEAFCDNLSFAEGFDNVYDLSVDDSPWFRDQPPVTCPCCDDVNCHMWGYQDVVVVGGTRRPSCPISNNFKRDIFERYLIIDDVANVTSGSGIGTGVPGEMNFCLSPTGCFSLKHEIENGRNDHGLTWDREYKVGFSSVSRALEEQDTCDEVTICGVPIGPDHPRRMGLNHLTHIALSDLSFLDNPSSFQYQALCWMMTEDTMFHEYDVCDGTLLQRYILVYFLYTFREAFGFQTLNPNHTCEWPGVTCDSLNNKFIEHLHFSGRGLTGFFVTELGLLPRLKTLDLSSNSLVDVIDPKSFEYMPNLEVFDISFNQFGGTLPKTLLQLPSITEINLSNNLLTGELPFDVQYSKRIKKFDVENNLFINFIPTALLDCPELEVVNLSRNNLKGNIPVNIGLLERMREIILHQNNLSGSLPIEIFDLKNIEQFEVQSNSFTGLIHKNISNFQNARFISLSHNEFKGHIPKEMEGMRNLEFLHLHNNLLTGDAPNLPWLREVGIKTRDLERYISDCGSPWYSLPNPLSCTTCTLCCNSDEQCQENLIWPIPIERGAFGVTFAVPVAFGILCYVVFKTFHVLNFSLQGLDTRDATDFLDEDSTYCLIFCNNYMAWTIYLIVYVLQGTFYFMFLLASSFTTLSSDWQFTFQCPSTSTDCKNYSTVNAFGWVMFFVVTLFTLSVDYINSGLQLRKAVAIFDSRLFISGFLHMSMTVLALFCSYYYNMALATTNTELIVNAVILLFINDLDEQLMNALQAVVPDWVEARVEEVRGRLTRKQRRGSVNSVWSQNSNKRRGSAASSKNSAGRRRGSLTSAVVSFSKRRSSGESSDAADNGRRLSGVSSVGWSEADYGDASKASGPKREPYSSNVFEEHSEDSPEPTSPENWLEEKLQEGRVTFVDTKE